VRTARQKRAVLVYGAGIESFGRPVQSLWERYRATGSGARTRDACSVDLYLRLPYAGEVELLRPWLAPGSNILELGCGVGRVTAHLLAAGHRVTAVDNSPDMLAFVPAAAERVCCDIERLQLHREFDAVLFASCLINVADDALRAEQLATCRSHLRAGGSLLFERYDPRWLEVLTAGPQGAIGEVEMSVDRVVRERDDIDLRFRYEHQGRTWTQSFVARALDDGAIAAQLAACGLRLETWVGARWGVARRDR
jgi:SAM-dependent methyltransferase